MSNPNEPVVHSEKGFDQSELPSEKANQAPDVEPEAVETANAAGGGEPES